MDVSFVLDAFDEIIEHVLSFIPGKQLYELMNLNSHWHSAASRILKKRTKPKWLRWNERNGSISTCYSNFMNDMYPVPDVIITFSSLHFVSSPCCQRHGCTSKKRKIDFDAFLRREMSMPFDDVRITSYGNIGIAGPSEKNPGFPKHFESPSATTMFWPKRDDLAIRVIPSFGDLHQGIQTEEGNNMNLKLLMALSTVGRNFESEVWPVHCLVAGCKVSSLKYNGDTTRSLCLAFFGKANIAVASVVVSPEDKQAEDVEKRLTEFIPFLKRKFCCSNGDNNRPSFDIRKFSDRIQGYVFSCVDRLPSGKRTNGDLASFAKVLPGVPLFGLSGFGEIGMDATDEESLSRAYSGGLGFVMKDNCYVASSVFVLLTF